MPERYAAWKIADLYSAPVRTPWGEKGEDPVTLHENGSVSVTAVWRLGGQKEARCRITYTFEPSGRVLAEMKLTAAECMGEMPLFGWTFKTDADFDRLRYYGLGPEENYIDRREGARLGIFETTARENLSRYLYPQECGNRTGVRWAEVKDFRGRGLRFTAEDGMEFSILPYTAHELENAAHAYELPEAYCTVIRAAKVQMGVGGDDSWGARTHEEYLVRPEEGMSFRFAFEPLI